MGGNSFGMINNPPQRRPKPIPPRLQEECDDMEHANKSVTIDSIEPCAPGQKKCYKLVLKVKSKKKKVGETEGHDPYFEENGPRRA